MADLNEPILVTWEESKHLLLFLQIDASIANQSHWMPIGLLEITVKHIFYSACTEMVINNSENIYYIFFKIFSTQIIHVVVIIVNNLTQWKK